MDWVSMCWHGSLWVRAVDEFLVAGVEVCGFRIPNRVSRPVAGSCKVPLCGKRMEEVKEPQGLV